jgi:hypothetical protein
MLTCVKREFVTNSLIYTLDGGNTRTVAILEMSLSKRGVIVLQLFCVNLHLKPPEWRVSLQATLRICGKEKVNHGIRCPKES